MTHVCFSSRGKNYLKWLISFLIIFLIVYSWVTQLSKASLYGIFNIFTVKFNDDTIVNVDENSQEHLLLENIAKKESELINTRLKLFFVQTSENEDIISRHACSIESAARLHPNGLIFVLMRIHFDENEIYLGTSLTRLNNTRRQQFIHYFSISHMSDFIRTALLYKYGGIYFDLDVIPLKNFAAFSNTVALETDDGVNVAVLVFEKKHFVLDVQMNKQLKSVENQFNALCWNCLGPLALTEALKNVCDAHQLHIRQKDKCHQITIEPSYLFYPISYDNIPQFFRYSTENVNFLIQNSSIYSIHYFHHMTMNLPIEIKSPFARIAEIYCPNVYEDLIDANSSNQSSTFVFTHINMFIFCLVITFLCIFIFLSISLLLSYFRCSKIIAFTLKRKLHK